VFRDHRVSIAVVTGDPARGGAPARRA